MKRRLIAGFLLFALVLVVALEVPFGISLSHDARVTAFSELRKDAGSLSVVVGTALDRHDFATARRVLIRYAVEDRSAVLLEEHGQVLVRAGSKAAEEADDPGTRRLLAAARRGRVATAEVSSDGDDDFLSMALPVGASLAVQAAPKTSKARRFVLVLNVSAAPLHRRIAAYWLALGLFGAGALAVAAVLGTLIARSLSRPVSQIERAVAALGAGALSERAPVRRRPAELRSLGQAVNEMADRLQELLGAQRAFVADASHQLRTPMTALRLRLENLERSLGGSEEEQLALAIAEVDRLSRLVDGLLSLARAEGSRPVRQAVEAAAVAGERAEVWRALAEERQVVLSFAKPAEAGRALACEGHLEQILDNLLSNALEATPPGGEVSLRVRRSNGEVELRVTDSGPGMSLSERERAFDRFWRADGSGSGGTGLGLAIVAQLVRVSGGSVRLEAAEKGGVEAVVTLEADRSRAAQPG